MTPNFSSPMAGGLSCATSSEQAVPAASLLLQVRHLAKAFGPTQALSGASLDVEAGSVHALLGENGSGKSTLAKILTGVEKADSGEILVSGTPIAPTSAEHAHRLGLAIVFQELSLMPDLSIADNLAVGKEAGRFPFRLLRREAEAERAREALADLGVDLDPARPVRRIDMAQRQLVEIAKALLNEPSILILDEPTSTLTEHEKEKLFAIVRDLRQRNTAILYVTHHLREVLQIADRVSVMRDGRIVASEPVTKGTTEDHLLDMLSAPKSKSDAHTRARTGRVNLLTVEGLRGSEEAPGVSFSVEAGEIVGLYGVVGCGRELVARSLVGLHPHHGGVVRLDGARIGVRNPTAALKAGIGYLPAGRAENGILPNRSVLENLNLSRLSEVGRRGVIRKRSEKDEAKRQLVAFGVKYGAMEDPITTLSGGNQQKVLFARTVLAGPRLLVLEDPTAGIDAGAKLEIYEQARRLAEAGKGLLWLSSDVTETLRLCDRIYAMHDGRIVDEIVAPTLDDEDRLLSMILGKRAA